MHKSINNFAQKYLDLPKYVQFIISWIIIIGLVGSFLWVNNNYLHIPLGGDTEECSGTFEFNCGSIEDQEQRINE